MTYKYEYAGFWIRVGAFIIDTLIFLLAIIPALGVIYNYDLALFHSSDFLNVAQTSGRFDILVNYIFPFLYSILFWIYLGGTPGKRLLRLKVLDEQTGHKLSLGQAIIRYIGYLPSIMVFFLGFIWIAFDSKKQAWHDKMAKTVVVREL